MAPDLIARSRHALQIRIACGLAAAAIHIVTAKLPRAMRAMQIHAPGLRIAVGTRITSDIAN